MNNNEYKIIIAGFGGQGVVLAGTIIAKACLFENKNVTQMVSYGAEMRGGTANTALVVSDSKIASPVVENPDTAVILNQPSLDKFESLLVPGALVVINKSLAAEPLKRKDVDAMYINASEIADSLGDIRAANIVALGALVKKTGMLEIESLRRAISAVFTGPKASLAALNLKALQAGADLVQN